VAFGNAYIFNLYGASVNVTMNGQGSAGTIPAPSQSSNYVPSQVVVPRTNLTQDQLSGQIVLCQGRNDISISSGGVQWQLAVNVPPNTMLWADLCLYLAYRQAFFFDSSGRVIN
jgi:hypothetical protein